MGLELLSPGAQELGLDGPDGGRIIVVDVFGVEELGNGRGVDDRVTVGVSVGTPGTEGLEIEGVIGDPLRVGEPGGR